MDSIYKIVPRGEWERAQELGTFSGSGIDHRDGFIHFSTAAQAQETARLHFRGQGGLVVLEVDIEALGAALKWEPSRGGALFPHLYGELAVASVSHVFEAPLGDDDVPQLRLDR